MRLAVLASGSGTLLDAMASDGLPIELVMVDRHCPVEDVAARHAIPCVVVERTDFGDGFDRDAFTDRVVATFARWQAAHDDWDGTGSALRSHVSGT